MQHVLICILAVIVESYSVALFALSPRAPAQRRVIANQLVPPAPHPARLHMPPAPHPARLHVPPAPHPPQPRTPAGQRPRRPHPRSSSPGPLSNNNTKMRKRASKALRQAEDFAADLAGDDNNNNMPNWFSTTCTANQLHNKQVNEVVTDVPSEFEPVDDQNEQDSNDKPDDDAPISDAGDEDNANSELEPNTEPEPTTEPDPKEPYAPPLQHVTPDHFVDDV